MIITPTTADIREELKRLYKEGKFREGKFGKTVEIQNAHFLADHPWIIREPDYDYAKREIEWYESQSLYVQDIPGKTPKIWEQCADKNGKINSNYGWCIFSKENGDQFNHCVERLIADPHTREACMIYTRPSMQVDCNSNGMHDFMCTYATQAFLNDYYHQDYDKCYILDYTVFQRSCDAVFGYNSDSLWHHHVHLKLVDELNKRGIRVVLGSMIYNCGSLHTYERHFKFLNE